MRGFSSRIGIRCAVLACLLGVGLSSSARATFTTSYTDGGNWQTLYAQGFRPSLTPSPDPGLAAGDTVYLSKFDFFKSGTPDTAANIQLVILNNIFVNLQGLTTSSGAVVGVSNNTVLTTAPIATGAPIDFTFNNLPLTYGNDYAAVYANIDGSGNITPVRVSSLAANYSEQPPGSGTFKPTTNYGTESQFQYATSNFIQTNSFGSFFNTFSFAGDANFVATMDVPEPGSIAAVSLIGIGALARRRRRRA